MEKPTRREAMIHGLHALVAAAGAAAALATSADEILETMVHPAYAGYEQFKAARDFLREVREHDDRITPYVNGITAFELEEGERQIVHDFDTNYAGFTSFQGRLNKLVSTVDQRRFEAAKKANQAFDWLGGILKDIKDFRGKVMDSFGDVPKDKDYERNYPLVVNARAALTQTLSNVEADIDTIIEQEGDIHPRELIPQMHQFNQAYAHLKYTGQAIGRGIENLQPHDLQTIRQINDRYTPILAKRTIINHVPNIITGGVGAYLAHRLFGVGYSLYKLPGEIK